MTREEKIAKLGELRQAIDAKVSEYNEHILDKEYEEAYAMNEEIEKLVNEHTSTARDIAFDEILDCEDPMIEAVRRLTYGTISAKDVSRDEDGVKYPMKSVVEIAKDIDLSKLHAKAKKNGNKDGIGADPKWDYYVQKFNFLLTAQKAVDLGINPKGISDTYDMADIAKEIDMGKTPTSKTNILKTLQKVIAAMIGEEYKATSHDVAFLMSIYSRKNRAALTVTCANHRYLRKYLSEICHRLVNNDSYKIAYKEKK